MRKLLLLFFVLSFFGTSFAQKNDDGDDEQLAKRTLLEDAEFFYLNEEYAKALNRYLQVLKNDTANYKVYYRIGSCYLNLPFENGRSIPYLRKAVKKIIPNEKYKDGSIKETNAPFDALYFLGWAYHQNMLLDEAIYTYRRYKDTLPTDDIYNIQMADRQMLSCENAKDLIKKPIEIEIGNVGREINSAQADFNPCTNSDGSIMIFTRIRAKMEKDTTKEFDVEDNYNQILISKRIDDEHWEHPRDITNELGAKGQCYTLNLSADGTELLLYRDDWYNGGVTQMKTGSIYYSKLNPKTKRWSTIKMLNSNINSMSWESNACISPDGKRIFFTSDRKGGLGGLDIYVSEKVGDDWGPAKNLGPAINTPYDEESPIMLADGKTLYFSSEGHNNMGGYDIFYSVQQQNKMWSTPVNIGSPINSTGENLLYVPYKDGSEAYYAQARHEGYITFGDMDIYQLVYVKHDSVVVKPVEIMGTVKYADMNELDTSTTVYLVDTISGKVVAKTKPDVKTGKYSMTVEKSCYKLVVRADGYRDNVKSVIVSKASQLQQVTVDVNMIPSSVNASKYFTIRSVFFAFNSADLNREALIEVEKLYRIMNENPGLYIEVIGHTDTKGSSEYNKKLSIKRSRAVIDFLVKKGIEEKRFVALGEGKERVIAVDTDDKGAAIDDGARLNRRVEIRILRADNDMVVTMEEQVPEALRFKNFNRFSIALAESKDTLASSSWHQILKDTSIKIMYFQTAKGFLYYFGDFKTKAEASKPLNEVISKGFPNAYIVDYFELNKLNKFNVTNKVNYFARYTIQLKAIDKSIIIDAPGIKDIKMYRTKDGFNRYTYKEFTDIELAKAELQRVIELGFADAFIIEVSKLKE